MLEADRHVKETLTEERPGFWFYFFVAIFFGFGATMGTLFSLSAIDDGKPVAGSIVAGAGMGGVTAWLTFYCIGNLLAALGVVKRPEQIPGGPPVPKKPDSSKID